MAEVRAMAVIPLEEYRKLSAQNQDKIPETDDPMVGAGEHDHDDISGVHSEEIPKSLELVIQCAPSRMQNRALMLLKHMASLNGKIKYDMDTGELLIDDQHIPGSNLSDIMRILLTHRPNSKEPRESIGIRAFLNVIASSAMPSSLIHDEHWNKFLRDARSTNKDYAELEPDDVY